MLPSALECIMLMHKTYVLRKKITVMWVVVCEREFFRKVPFIGFFVSLSIHCVHCLLFIGGKRLDKTIASTAAVACAVAANTTIVPSSLFRFRTGCTSKMKCINSARFLNRVLRIYQMYSNLDLWTLWMESEKRKKNLWKSYASWLSRSRAHRHTR